MVDREVFDRRLARIEELLRHLRRAAKLEKSAFLGDPMATAATERWLQLASECTLDLAHHVIADRGWKTPDTYREAFQVPCDEGALNPELAGKMKQWAGLRNVLQRAPRTPVQGSVCAQGPLGPVRRPRRSLGRNDAIRRSPKSQVRP